MLPLGGIPAVAVMNDTMAVAYSGDNGSIQVGYGLTLTYNAQSVKDSAGISWVYLSQPMDADADTLRPFGEGFFAVFQSLFQRQMLPMMLFYMVIIYGLLVGQED